ncbi:MAG: orotidine-5'-phosphate decarboxylase [Crocinitomicaceae bacterium]|nr:orotidine-5'-phosphate decarboxylase [Crocinitomicaceae bacterium]
MNREQLVSQIKSKKSFLCVGLDTDLEKIPSFLLAEEDPIFEFNKRIIDVTKEYAVAYKPNIAFYECLGASGWKSLKRTLDYIPNECFTIADAKRGDIGNTAARYAKTFFDKSAAGLDFDSITIAPYMGEDSVTPFLKEGKWAILLALTSNPGSNDFQQLKVKEENKLFEEVITTSRQWADSSQLMFVVGATRGEAIAEVRKLANDNFFLVPGIGAQGGSLEEVVKYGMTSDCGLLINSSRGIIYAGSDKNFDVAAGEEAKKIQTKMADFLTEYKIM